MIPTLAQLARLVGNPAAYALQTEDGSYRPVREQLSPAALAKHLKGEHTVGTYIGHRIEAMTVARTLVFDIDNGSMDDADRILIALGELGIPSSALGLENSGRKGYHIWLPLQEYRPNSELRRLGRAALALSGVDCEVYPKQDEVKDLGSLVKMPGGIHQVTQTLGTFLDRVPMPLPMALWVPVIEGLPQEQARKHGGGESRFPCLDAIQSEGVKKGSRNNQLFHLSVMLRRAGVSDDNVETIVRHTNTLGDPLEEFELLTLLESSKLSGPLCEQLPGERQCGELCIKARTAGLYTRPRQLRYAAEGENVVVTLVGRKGNVIEFTHPDVGKMKAVLDGDRG